MKENSTDFRGDKTANQWFVVLGLVAICALGMMLQLHNVSGYKFYPDSYVNLVEARNISNFGSVVGRLGSQGMVYPDVWYWTRPLYPLLIALTLRFGADIFSAAHFWNLLFSLLSPVLAYLLAKKLTKSETSGLITAFVLAVSYNRIVWSGFILTEASSIFFLLLFLFMFAKALEQESELLSIWQLLAGVVFVFLMLTRYEFVILILPAGYLIFRKAAKPWIFLVNFALAGFVTLSMFLFWLSPLPAVTVAFKTLIEVLSGGLATLAVIFFWAKSKLTIPRAVWIVLVIILCLGAFKFRSLGLFVRHDFVLVGLSALSLLLNHDSQEDDWFGFSVLGFVLLGLLYLVVNPEIERYWADTLALLLIPVAFVAKRLFLDWPRLSKVTRAVLIVLLLASLATQSLMTATGLHKVNNGIWYQAGYEETVARQIARNYQNSSLLLVSFPEPYYIFTDKSVMSISDRFPYLYADDSVNADTILIVEDYGMVDQFPNFTVFLRQNLGAYRINTINVDTLYRFAGRIQTPNQPVEVYEIKVGELKNLIKLSTNQ